MIKATQLLRPDSRSTSVRRLGSPVYVGAAQRMLALQGISGPTGGFNAERRRVGGFGPVNPAGIPASAARFDGGVVDALPGPNAWSPPV